MIKLLLGGSPCTNWSIAKKDGRETESSGIGWELFKNYVIAKDKFRPDVFLYENVASASPLIKEAISEHLGVDLNRINSALVSAQNRDRIYGINAKVEPPEDRHIYLRDILESGVTNKEKAYTLRASAGTKQGNSNLIRHIQSSGRYGYQGVFEPVRIGDIGSTAQAHRVYSPDGKSVALCAGGGGQGGKTGLYAVPVVGYMPCKNGTVIKSQSHRIYTVDGKASTITVSQSGGNSDISSPATGLYAVPTCVAQRGRYIASCSRSVKAEGGTEQYYEARTDGKTNSLTTVQKDNMVAEPVNVCEQSNYKVYLVENGQIEVNGIYTAQLVEMLYARHTLIVASGIYTEQAMVHLSGEK